jgi:8-oxo-dGTP diphosphatase
MPNKWELPGGKLDIGQDIANALEREVLEETGLVVVPTDKIAYWHSEIVASGKYKGLPYVVLVGITKSVGGKVMLSPEHQHFEWVKVRAALKLDLAPETRSAVNVLASKLTLKVK